MKPQQLLSTAMTVREPPCFRWDGSEVLNISSTSFSELDDGRYLLTDFGTRFRVEPYKSSVSLVIDEFKPLFGLPKIGRHVLRYIDFSSVLISREIGYEYPVPSNMHDSYDVYKTRLFRWLLGLSSKFITADMIVRSNNNIVEVISSNDSGVNFDRPDPTYVTNIATRWDPNDTFKEMLYGYDITTLYEELSDIVLRIDPSMIWYPTQIVSRLDMYGFLETSGSVN